MALKRMLVDASHPEETRVVVLDGNKLEDYDVEVASRRQLKGNIYLAKVTRVEPSLQAAFVDYGGNRHGFLAFNEIHPDYYQIPIADRERLIAEQAAESGNGDDNGEDGEGGDTSVDDDEDLGRRRSRPPSRFYKIQEVIKRRQILLVQVAKEERGNKGAALTTYLSLAGRYCVLMPNTARGGGISRKIGAATDRKRLKKILTELEVPDGMAVIVRTAGAGRSKAEIKRDYEYLVRLWSSIREKTLQSTAPTLVHEEASLIKRSIRDLYVREIEEIVVQGEPEYRIAKEFMKLFISSHAKRVKLYEDTERSLYQQYQIEDQLDLIHRPTVQLRSGGYIVLNPTEALVAIDVNSGRATRERNIEETALRTNIEAADEIARQLRLRDLAGLIVVDFIDMENPRNQGMVERRLKEAMKNDRARVQIGRISAFGLLELSRQRLRPSLLETSFEVCASCAGMGLRRSTDSTALAILRKLEEEGLKHRASEISITLPPAVALYLLNQKRRALQLIEDRYGLAITILEDDSLVPPDHRIERGRTIEVRPAEEVVEVEEVVEEPSEPAAAERDDAGRRGRRRRPRRRRRGDEAAMGVDTVAEAEAEDVGEDVEEDVDEADAAEETVTADAAEQSEQPGRKRRRRGKRGGRRRGRPGGAAEPLAAGEEAAAVGSDAMFDDEHDDVSGGDEDDDEQDDGFDEHDDDTVEHGGEADAWASADDDDSADADDDDADDDGAAADDESEVQEIAAGSAVAFAEDGVEAGVEAVTAEDDEAAPVAKRRRRRRSRRPREAAADVAADADDAWAPASDLPESEPDAEALAESGEDVHDGDTAEFVVVGNAEFVGGDADEDERGPAEEPETVGGVAPPLPFDDPFAADEHDEDEEPADEAEHVESVVAQAVWQAAEAELPEPTTAEPTTAEPAAAEVPWQAPDWHPEPATADGTWHAPEVEPQPAAAVEDVWQAPEPEPEPVVGDTAPPAAVGETAAWEAVDEPFLAADETVDATGMPAPDVQEEPVGETVETSSVAPDVDPGHEPDVDPAREPEPVYVMAAVETAEADVAPAMPAVAEVDAMNAPGDTAEAIGEPETAAARSDVVRVGEDDVGDEGPRRGWWQRLLQ